MKRFHLALGVLDVETSAQDYSHASAAGRTCSSLSDEKRQASCSSHMPMYAG